MKQKTMTKKEHHLPWSDRR